MGWLQRLLGAPTQPAARRGASSFHLWFGDVGDGVPVAVSVTLTVLAEPTVPDLYFWALQATFSDERGAEHGAAHLGLQWNIRHRGHRAANWGGYAQAADVRSVLRGTDSMLPGVPNDPNTRDYQWVAGVPYRLRISRGEHGWRGDITDPTNPTVMVRELFAGGDRLRSFVVWSEVFASCEAPPASVRWSEPTVEFEDGTIRRPRSLKVNFPEGCCPDVDVWVDEIGVIQMSGTRRTARHGQLVPVPPLT